MNAPIKCYVCDCEMPTGLECSSFSWVTASDNSTWVARLYRLCHRCAAKATEAINKARKAGGFK